MATIKVFGASDDLVCVECQDGPARDGLDEEFDCYDPCGDADRYLAFNDGTVLHVIFDPDEGLWRITPQVHGSAQYTKVFEATDPAGSEYSDVIELVGDVTAVVFGKHYAAVRAKGGDDG